MNIDLKIRYSTADHSWLCFRHAIAMATQGETVETEIDDYGSEYYLGTTQCVICEAEETEARKR